MKTLNQILIIVCVLCLHKTDSLVVTRFDSETMSTYLKLVRHSKKAHATEESFLTKNVSKYCLELRILGFYDSVQQLPTSAQDILQLINPFQHRTPTNILNMERNQGNKSTRKIQIRNTNQTMNFLTFYCLNVKKEPSWLIAPAFIPDSAFLFEIEPTFRHVVSREINQKNEIPARLIGIIDESGSFIEADLSHYQNSNSTRDELCDLNFILQNRICSLVADAMQRTILVNPLARLNSDHRSSHTYQDRPAEPEDKCKKPTRPTREIVFHKMLYCFNDMMGMRKYFYVASNVLSHPSDVFYCVQHVLNSTIWFTTYAIYRIPLLQHLRTYTELLVI